MISSALPSPSLSRIPVEIWLHILSLTDPDAGGVQVRSHARLTQTCHYFHTMLNACLYSTYTVFPFGYRTRRPVPGESVEWFFGHVMTKYGHLITSLDLSSISDTMRFHSSEQGDGFLWGRVPNLNVLVVTGWRVSAKMARGMSHLGQLTELVLCDCVIESVNELFLNPEGESVQLSALASGCRVMEWRGCCVDGGQLIQMLMRHGHVLRHMAITHWSIANLSTRSEWEVSEKWVAWLMQWNGMRELRELDVRGCMNVVLNDDMIEAWNEKRQHHLGYPPIRVLHGALVD